MTLDLLGCCAFISLTFVSFDYEKNGEITVNIVNDLISHLPVNSSQFQTVAFNLTFCLAVLSLEKVFQPIIFSTHVVGTIFLLVLSAHWGHTCVSLIYHLGGCVSGRKEKLLKL